jgi:hypothetical protein
MVIREKWRGIIRAGPGSAVMTALWLSAIPFRHGRADLGRRNIIAHTSPGSADEFRIEGCPGLPGDRRKRGDLHRLVSGGGLRNRRPLSGLDG